MNLNIHFQTSTEQLLKFGNGWVISSHIWFMLRSNFICLGALWWRHNDHDSVSNHQPHECLLKRLFRRRSKKTSKLRVTGLCVRNSPGPVNSPHKGPVTRKMFPFDDVIMERGPWKTWIPFHTHRNRVNVWWWEIAFYDWYLLLNVHFSTIWLAPAQNHQTNGTILWHDDIAHQWTQ